MRFCLRLGQCRVELHYGTVCGRILTQFPLRLSIKEAVTPAQTQLLLFTRTVINGKDLVSSRCIKGRKEEKCEVTFLPSSQVPLCASIFLFIFLCDKEYGLSVGSLNNKAINEFGFRRI